MWYDYFVGFIAIVAIVRLVLLWTGEMSGKDKVAKSTNWLIGLVLMSITWGLLSYVFGQQMGQIGGGTSNDKGIIKPDNHPQSQSTDGETIEIKIGDE